MSYTYLQGPGAESSAECFSDIEPFVRSKLNLTAERSCCNDSGTESCRGSRSGTTCERSTDVPGGESSMSSVAGSLAKTSALPERAQESTANDRACGAKWHESLAKYDPVSRSWKTRQLSFIEDSGECLATFPQWGTTRDGELFLLPTPAPRTCGKESGFWPTPGAANANSDIGLTCSGDGRKTPNKLGWAVAERMWPTPLSSDATKGGPNQRDSRGRPSLTMAAMTWPTPTKSDGMGGPGNSGRNGGLNLRTVVMTLPTPKSRYWKGQSQRGIRGPMDSLANLDRGDGKTIGGSLNPDWVEWLMNWPIKWSEANAIDIENFKRWQEASATALSDSDGVRIVWWDRDPSATPQGPRHFQQQSGEHCDALQQVSRETACGRTMERTHENADLHELREFIQVQEGEGNDMQQGVRKSLGVDFPEVIPRVTTKTPNRTDRLKAIGNGQVPSVAALAWRILSNS